MILSDTAIKNRVSVLVLIVIIVGLGLYSYAVLPRESDPDITIPYVFVQTDYRGSPPRISRRPSPSRLKRNSRAWTRSRISLRSLPRGSPRSISNFCPARTSTRS